MDYVLCKLKGLHYYVPPTQPTFSEITEPRDIQLKSGNKMIAVAKGLEAMGNEGDPGIPATSLLMAIGAAIENSDIDSIHLEFDIGIDFEKINDWFIYERKVDVLTNDKVKKIYNKEKAFEYLETNKERIEKDEKVLKKIVYYIDKYSDE